MAKPLAKKSVDLASSGGVRVSRIRRDPPPKAKEKEVDPKEREQWDVTIGVLAFALSIFVIILGFWIYQGRGGGEPYTVEVNLDE